MEICYTKYCGDTGAVSPFVVYARMVSNGDFDMLFRPLDKPIFDVIK